MNQRLLVCTDMDRTLLPNGEPEESDGARAAFRFLVGQPEVTLVYVTGRHRALVEAAIEEFDVPLPDYVIADVGSTIYRVEDKHWEHWRQWDEAIAIDWNGRSREELAKLFGDIDLLQLQEAEKQNTHKLSYYAPEDVDSGALIADMQSRLEAHDIRANLIWSIDDAEHTGLLDVLPASASKRHAIEFMMQTLGYSIDEVVFSGDSGNDLAVLTSPIHAVVVANATDALKAEAQGMAESSGEANALYVARGGFLGMNGNYSAGILEGIAHYLPDYAELMIQAASKKD